MQQADPQQLHTSYTTVGQERILSSPEENYSTTGK
jgi:hypothetical protein